MLRDPVRRVLGSATANVQTWDARLLGNVANPIARGVYRVSGTASDASSPRAWSLVLKAYRDSGLHQSYDARSRNYWKREFMVYGSGLHLDLPPGLRAPVCYGVEERPDGSGWLWLEDLTDAYGIPWPIERYAVAARHTGQFNGAYLAGRPIPDVPWLSAGVGMTFIDQLGPQLERVQSLYDHPLARREWPYLGLLERSSRLWKEKEAFSATLNRLPQTLSHLDVTRLNLFAVRSPEGTDTTVAIDWAFLGRAAVGEELASLVWGSPVVAGEHADRARELGEICFEGYLTGLRDAGWGGDERLARLGYTAGVIRFGGAYSPMAIDNPTVLAALERAWGNFGEMLDRLAMVRPYMLDLADEARDLIARLE